MPEEKPKISFCPSCGQPAIRTGDDVACEKCDAIFRITSKDGAQVKKIGTFEDHEQRISKLESLLGPDVPEPESPIDHIDPDDVDTGEPEEDNDDEGDILPR